MIYYNLGMSEKTPKCTKQEAQDTCIIPTFLSTFVSLIFLYFAVDIFSKVVTSKETMSLHLWIYMNASALSAMFFPAQVWIFCVGKKLHQSLFDIILSMIPIAIIFILTLNLLIAMY